MPSNQNVPPTELEWIELGVPEDHPFVTSKTCCLLMTEEQATNYQCLKEYDVGCIINCMGDYIEGSSEKKKFFVPAAQLRSRIYKNEF